MYIQRNSLAPRHQPQIPPTAATEEKAPERGVTSAASGEERSAAVSCAAGVDHFRSHHTQYCGSSLAVCVSSFIRLLTSPKRCLAPAGWLPSGRELQAARGRGGYCVRSWLLRLRFGTGECFAVEFPFLDSATRVVSVCELPINIHPLPGLVAGKGVSREQATRYMQTLSSI